MTRSYLTIREREDILNRAHAMRSAYLSEGLRAVFARMSRAMQGIAHA